MENILQIDVEDWFMDLDISRWPEFEDRVVKSTGKVLNLCEKTNSKATFFILASIAEKHPGLIAQIKAQGHEIGSHGYAHKALTGLTPTEFEADLLKSIDILEDISGEKVRGFRAPFFTVTKKTAWAIDIIQNCGLEYDSSIFPVKTHVYGVPDAPLFPYKVSAEDLTRPAFDKGLWEIPPSVYQLPVMNLPVAGGFYLRLFPYFFIKHAISKLNKAGRPAVCYLHPWELDPDHPRLKDLSWYHYYRLASTPKKFERLLEDFQFTSTWSWIKDDRR